MYPDEASSFSVLSIGHEYLPEQGARSTPPSSKRRDKEKGHRSWGSSSLGRAGAAAQPRGARATGSRADGRTRRVGRRSRARRRRPHGMLDVGFDCAVTSRISHVRSSPLASGSRWGEAGREEGLLVCLDQELLCAVEILDHP
jgi:hypothetical protein